MLWRLGRYWRNEPVGVFVGAALPGVVWRGEVEARAGRALEFRVLMELGAVVDGDGTHRLWLRAYTAVADFLERTIGKTVG